jgi:hypothetical protein
MLLELASSSEELAEREMNKKQSFAETRTQFLIWGSCVWL